jgi:3-deoxy-D-manno-octulosonate 8-phosphate phosphatase (KDO 8-P phosphatase)
MANLRKRVTEGLHKVKVLGIDFDGTLTDGFVHMDQDGKETVRCSRRDSLGINMVQAAGIHVVIISKETNPVVQARARKMRVECYSGVETGDEKLAILMRYLLDKKVSIDEVAYVGDDVNDLAVLQRVGYPMTVADGSLRLKEIACYVTKRRGGDHAVREVCDLILESRR